jgi:hypothetical protein
MVVDTQRTNMKHFIKWSYNPVLKKMAVEAYATRKTIKWSQIRPVPADADLNAGHP